MDVYLGFDPGGERHFGWAVCSSTERVLHVLAKGKASHAEEAVSEARSRIPSNCDVVGTGIDAPLFWADNGGRRVDAIVRSAIKKLGAPSPGGTVQSVNSLRGACLVQGVMVGYLLHHYYPKMIITESHPKALLYLLGIANRHKSPSAVLVRDLSEYVKCDDGSECDDERDAILGAVTAFAQRERRQGWRDLFREERRPVVPFEYLVEYWMPC